MLPALYPQSKYSTPQLEQKVQDIIGKISNKRLSALAEVVTGINGFYTAPAGKRLHHPYIGGLAEHSVAVAEIVDKAAVFYPDVNKDIAITGALLHDIGKVKELVNDKIWGEYTDKGKLLSHIYIGANIVQNIIADKSLDVPADDIIHIILSHHGDNEKGALIKPATIEANLVYLADYMDSHMGIVNQMCQSQICVDGWVYDSWLGKSVRVGDGNDYIEHAKNEFTEYSGEDIPF